MSLANQLLLMDALNQSEILRQRFVRVSLDVSIHLKHLNFLKFVLAHTESVKVLQGVICESECILELRVFELNNRLFEVELAKLPANTTQGIIIHGIDLGEH